MRVIVLTALLVAGVFPSKWVVKDSFENVILENEPGPSSFVLSFRCSNRGGGVNIQALNLSPPTDLSPPNARFSLVCGHSEERIYPSNVYHIGFMTLISVGEIASLIDLSAKESNCASFRMKGFEKRNQPSERLAKHIIGISDKGARSKESSPLQRLFPPPSAE